MIGAGIVGMSLAGFLAHAGLDVTVLDAAVAGGSTANAGSLHVQMQSRFMRLFPDRVPGMERQLPLYPKAVRYWREFETLTGGDFELKQSGGLMVADTPQQLDFLRIKSRRERELGLATEVIGRDALHSLAPWLDARVLGAELCADEGKLNPLKCNAAVRAWARRGGATFVEPFAVPAFQDRSLVVYGHCFAFFFVPRVRPSLLSLFCFLLLSSIFFPSFFLSSFPSFL
ncbi:NAD(P)/FAD-dependent oxidoreductase, partial [Burkholderia sp. Ac-20379]|uniref:NAD(P)/FAD-dependent oxidoreductase n=1 Tax=Burkholderia sp. Ac-20379 TaxID=2703900 RepID=UPI0030DA2F10